MRARSRADSAEKQYQEVGRKRQNEYCGRSQTSAQHEGVALAEPVADHAARDLAGAYATQSAIKSKPATVSSKPK